MWQCKFSAGESVQYGQILEDFNEDDLEEVFLPVMDKLTGVNFPPVAPLEGLLLEAAGEAAPPMV